MKRAWQWTSAASIVTAIVGAASSLTSRNTRKFTSENHVDARTVSGALRTALHAALERTKPLLASHGIFNMSASEHVGLDQRTRVMVQIVGSKSQLAVD
ncbi:hypothetical protein BWP39_16855 [Paraburkholderia acidicola]|uniref:Uncharacterized protein n=1 Tax=Paraburkholderia acidicola TaxID=1912599 RepID=A0A2A4F0U1_9BURK|nr:hypothetical protein BWP39_16855 [Paraburkholderia acidicola]